MTLQKADKEVASSTKSTTTSAFHLHNLSVLLPQRPHVLLFMCALRLCLTIDRSCLPRIYITAQRPRVLLCVLCACASLSLIDCPRICPLLFAMTAWWIQLDDLHLVLWRSRYRVPAECTRNRSPRFRSSECTTGLNYGFVTPNASVLNMRMLRCLCVGHIMVRCVWGGGGDACVPSTKSTYKSYKKIYRIFTSCTTSTTKHYTFCKNNNLCNVSKNL